MKKIHCFIGEENNVVETMTHQTKEKEEIFLVMPQGVQLHKVDAAENPNEIILNITICLSCNKWVRADTFCSFDRICVISQHDTVVK